MYQFSRSSILRMQGIAPELVLVLSRALLRSSIDFAVLEGIRTRERQRELVAKGRSKTMNSKHLIGRAVDLVAVGDLDSNGHVDHKDRALQWDRGTYAKVAAAMLEAARELGIQIRWGGDWDRDGDTSDTRFFDGPHFELI